MLPSSYCQVQQYQIQQGCQQRDLKHKPSNAKMIGIKVKKQRALSRFGHD